VLGEHLAEAEPRVLILEQDGAGIDQLLGVLREHAVDRGGVVHIRQGVAVGEERVADLLELGLDRDGLEEDDEDALLDERAGLRIGDRLLDGGNLT